MKVSFTLCEENIAFQLNCGLLDPNCAIKDFVKKDFFAKFFAVIYEMMRKEAMFQSCKLKNWTFFFFFLQTCFMRLWRKLTNIRTSDI